MRRFLTDLWARLRWKVHFPVSPYEPSELAEAVRVAMNRRFQIRVERDLRLMDYRIGWEKKWADQRRARQLALQASHPPLKQRIKLVGR